MATVLITGANRGIGLELARQYRARGETVIAACRKASDELKQLDTELISGLDLADGASVDALAKQLSGRRLDVLFNNAGILRGDSIQALDPASIRQQFEVNAIGPLRLTQCLLSCLGDGAKVALVTSRMGSLADNTSGGRYGYRMSKAALNMAGVSLAHDLKPRGVAVAILHPGFVRTEMTAGNGNIDAAESARGLIARVDALSLDNSGTFWHQDGQILPW